jgi:hypothetical protein
VYQRRQLSLNTDAKLVRTPAIQRAFFIEAVNAERTRKDAAPALDSPHSRGAVGLLSGTFAIAVRKGSRLHRASGNIFTVAMLTLASSALCLAIMKSQHGNIVGSILTFYMITTAWLAGRRRGIGWLDLAALLVGTGGAAAIITLGVWTIHHPDKNAPAAMCFFMAAVLLFAAAGDIRMLARGGISGRRRITRHYGVCASDSSLQQGLSSLVSNRSSPLSSAVPSF